MRRRPRPNTRSIVGGRHRPLPGAASRRRNGGSQCGRALATPLRCTSSTVASSVLPLARASAIRSSQRARQRHRLAQHARASRRRRRACARRRCTARASRRGRGRAARRWRRRWRRCRPCAPGRRASRPRGGASPSWRKVSSRVSSSKRGSPRAREPVDAAVADPGDQPARREHVDRRAQRHRRRARRRRSRCAMRLAIARSASSIARRTRVGVEPARRRARACSCGDELRGSRSAPSRRRRRRRRRRRAARTVERAVRVLVDGVLAAARRRDRDVDPAERRCCSWTRAPMAAGRARRAAAPRRDATARSA